MGTQLTLGSLIKALAKLPAGLSLLSYVGVCSYRGNYHDLAVYREGTHQHDGTVGGFLALLCRVRDSELEGYKGGLFEITDKTDVFLVDSEDSVDSIALTDVQVITSAVNEVTVVTLK